MHAVDSENSKNLTSDDRRSGSSGSRSHRSLMMILASLTVMFLLVLFYGTCHYRMLQVMKSLADPTHPWSNFSTGNLSTLRDDLPPDFNIRTALLDLYHR